MICLNPEATQRDAGTFRQRTELSQPQKALFAKLKITEPPRVIHATSATP
ncbi:hypothetical protein [Micromonospora craniellae]|nr:hypothetical protein [Micromonospora craniellae]